jgi:hypothetical protein
MSINEFLKIADDIPANVETWYHARKASRGSVCQEQCHPFLLSGNAWYMHNGTFHIEPLEGMSDTQTVAEYLNEHTEIDADVYINDLCEASESRAVIIAPGKESKLFGHWEEYDGYKVSNTKFTLSTDSESSPQ